jgi:hypothetical protein
MGSNLAKGSRINLVVVIIFSVVLLIGATFDIYQLAQGSGSYLWGFSFKKGLAFFGFVTTFVIIFLGLLFATWNWEETLLITQKLTSWRDQNAKLCWLLAALTLILSIVIFQYTSIGIELTGFYFRLLSLILLGLSTSFFINSKKGNFITPSSLALSFLIIGSTFAFMSAFINVVNYPFSLHWSEGNQIWNYSVIFSRNRYNYPSDQDIFAFIDKGRQSLWGIPFLIPNVSIILVRLWNAFLVTLPYAIFGWIAFQRTPKNQKIWLISGLWAFLFLSQGPIYTPLILSAILVAIAWRSPVWVAIPLIVLASFYADTFYLDVCPSHVDRDALSRR